jgi:hypothetical protein
MTPFAKDFSDILKATTDDNPLLIAADDGMFSALLVQTLEREIINIPVKFFTIRNIVLEDEYKGKGLFSEFLQTLEETDVPIMFHDVVNARLAVFLESNGYSQHDQEKYGEKIISYYKL